ncbi:MAG TPA: alginate export family protein [Steroidobacter sp.]|uniref:alginate export family protein n=1 Tax=Steroidobacter sp. TaxID=1978227 RepID=UPI002ED9E4AD
MRLIVAAAIGAVLVAPLTRAQSWSLDVSGQLRERFESSQNPVFGLSEPAQNDVFLHRAALSGDLRQGDGFRALVEVVGGYTSGWAGSPPPTQDDPFDVLQAFVETSLPLANSEVVVRAGRQELTLGSSRLVSVRESPNIRRAFDGIRATWARSEDTRVDVFMVRPVFPEDGLIDDRSSSEQSFWGAYATFLPAVLGGAAMDAYYLGLRREDASFAQGQGRELRHSVGLRVFGESDGWDWNLEGVWQWGSFGAARIRAWTLSLDAGYTFSSVPFAPRVGLKSDAISGDRDPLDATLGTFNPLFPKLPYFSEANLVTPANLLDIQPSVSLSLTQRLNFSVSWNALWKYAEADAFYSPPLSAVDDTSMTSTTDIGRQVSTAIEWNASDDLSLAATYVTFEPRGVARQAGGRDGSFFMASIQLTF